MIQTSVHICSPATVLVADEICVRNKLFGDVWRRPFNPEFPSSRRSCCRLAIGALFGSMLAVTAVHGANGPRVLKNPYQSVNWDKVQHYIANFHAHTVYSDGRAEPDVLIKAYADAGYDILAITDHDNYHIQREGERYTEPTAETTWPWTRWIEEQPAQIWEHQGLETSAFYPDLGKRGMLAVRGNEFTTHPHIVSLFNNCGWLESGGQNDDERLSCVQGQGGLSWYAHPTDYVPGGRWETRVVDPTSWDAAVAYFGKYITRYENHLGIEMQLRARRERDEELLDRLLRAYYPEHDIYIYGGDDNHGTRVRDDATLNIVLAESLTEESVRHALVSGHNFVGSRSETYPVINRITVHKEQHRIVVEVENSDRIRWIKNGEPYTEGHAIDYADMEDAIVRFEIDIGEAVFYSQAFYISH